MVSGQSKSDFLSNSDVTFLTIKIWILESSSALPYSRLNGLPRCNAPLICVVRDDLQIIIPLHYSRLQRQSKLAVSLYRTRGWCITLDIEPQLLFDRERIRHSHRDEPFGVLCWVLSMVIPSGPELFEAFVLVHLGMHHGRTALVT